MSRAPEDIPPIGNGGFAVSDLGPFDMEDRPTFRPPTGMERGRGPFTPDRPTAVARPKWYEALLYGTVDDRQLEMFCRQLAVYLEAGVNLLPALDGLRQQFARTRLGPVIDRLIGAVRRGDPLGDAVAREPAVFDRLFRSMMRVAEARGGVPETLRTMSANYAARKRLTRQVKSALIYPAIVIVLTIGLVALLVIVVLPRLVAILEDFTRLRDASKIPLATRILIRTSDFVRTTGWWAIPLAMGLAVLVPLALYRTRRGKALLDELALRLPVVGPLLRKIDTTRFARTLSSLLGAGVDIRSSLDLTADVLLLTPQKRAIRRAREGVLEGVPLSSVLAASRRFYPDVVAIVKSGEETGRLPEMLVPLADDYEEQADYTVKNLGSLLQPLIILVLAGILLFIAFAFFSFYTTILSELASAKK